MLLYGATGYTGRLIAILAHQYGVRPILAGRDAAALATIAGELGLEHRAFALDQPSAIAHALAGVTVVLHCAGPFIHTSRPMADACIAAGVHYLDITGEIEVIESLAARDAEARRANVMLMPGTGFDVVPTDCLAAHLKRRLPSATRLTLAIRGTGRLSRGTKTTMVEHQDRGGMVRRNGKLTRVIPGWKTRVIDFGDGPRPAITIPWGDVATAYYSTGIPNIEVYAALPVTMRRALVLTRHLGWLLRMPFLKAWQKRRVRAGLPGPTPAELEQGRSYVWGEAADDRGHRVESRLIGPEGYLLTAHAALLIVKRVLSGNTQPGFQTPAKAYGPDLVLEIPGVERTDDSRQAT